MQFNDHPFLNEVLMLEATIDTKADLLDEYFKTLTSAKQQEAMIEYVARYSNSLLLQAIHPSEVLYEVHPRNVFMEEIAGYVNSNTINTQPFDEGDIVVESLHRMILDKLSTSRDIFLFLLYDCFVLFPDQRVTFTPFTKGRIIEACLPINVALKEITSLLNSTAPIDIIASYIVKNVEATQQEDQKILILLMLEGEPFADPLKAIAFGSSLASNGILDPKQLSAEDLMELRKFQSDIYRIMESGYNGCYLAKTVLVNLDKIEGLLNKITAISIYLYLIRTQGISEESEDVGILYKAVNSSDYVSVTLKGEVTPLSLKMI